MCLYMLIFCCCLFNLTENTILCTKWLLFYPSKRKNTYYLKPWLNRIMCSSRTVMYGERKKTKESLHSIENYIYTTWKSLENFFECWKEKLFYRCYWHICFYLYIHLPNGGKNRKINTWKERGFNDPHDTIYWARQRDMIHENAYASCEGFSKLSKNIAITY